MEYWFHVENLQEMDFFQICFQSIVAADHTSSETPLSSDKSDTNIRAK